MVLRCKIREVDGESVIGGPDTTEISGGNYHEEVIQHIKLCEGRLMQ